MNKSQNYPIGVFGKKWDDAERKEWLSLQSIKRSYQEEVLDKVAILSEKFDVKKYGSLSYNKERYPLFIIKSKHWNLDKKTVLVTGGVHGYETSGVQGAIRFCETKAAHYEQYFNIIVAPCISPWGYETINRWNPNAVDPNRSFYQQSPAEESSTLMNYIAQNHADILVHIDLHETTDTDNSSFRPALAARDAIEQKNWNIPDGFYLVGNTMNPEPAFQKAMIDEVEKVTHIAPADENGKLIGVDTEQWGVINYAARELGLCMGLTNAQYVTTTEVYPDSPQVDDENCIQAQVACIIGGLDFVLGQYK